MSWNQVGRITRTAFFLRVPLTTILLLAALGPFALIPGETMLGNLFDLRVALLNPLHPPIVDAVRTAWHLFTVSFTAFMLAWTAVAVINLVVHYGHDRFDDPELELDQKRPWQTFFLGLLAAMVLVSCVIFQTRIDCLLRYGIPFLGLVCSLGLVVLAKIVQLAFTDPTTTRHPPPYLVFPVYRIPWLERHFDAIYCWHPGWMQKSKGHFNVCAQWLLEIFRGAGQGYFVDCQAPKLVLRSGHVFAIALSLIAFALYVGIGDAKGRIKAAPAVVPALAFFLLFVIVACWFLSAITFFFDRYRVPLLTCIVLLSLTTTYTPESDHFYRVELGRSPPHMLRPSVLVANHKMQGHKRLIAIATAGGGIQAAAWTARVLSGLEEECANQKPSACDLRDSIVVLSSVSGGSLGAMAYARSFAPDLEPVSSATAVTNAETSAIDEVGWGWTVPDVFRAVVPWFRRKYIDRGWALEDKWRAIHNLRYSNPRRDVFLGDWAPSENHLMPGLLLNATVVETGRPIVFSNTDFPNGEKDTTGLVNFYDLMPGLKGQYDIRVNTAARLSSSFPFVAPAARSNLTNPPVPDYHIVDGGYYDNYGMVGLLSWLNNALADTTIPVATQAQVKTELADVLVLQIKSFPAVSDPTPHTRHGWGFQAIAPLKGIMDVRDVGQDARDDTELGLFTDLYKRKMDINVWRADFVYPNYADLKGCLEAPLSWKLSIDQLNCIEVGWQKFKERDGGQEIACVLAFLSGAHPTPAGDNESWACKPGDVPYLSKQ
jgi:hypothetical protein